MAEVKQTETPAAPQEHISKEDLLLLALQEERVKNAQQALELARLQVTIKYKLSDRDEVDMGSGLITRKA